MSTHARKKRQSSSRSQMREELQSLIDFLEALRATAQELVGLVAQKPTPPCQELECGLEKCRGVLTEVLLLIENEEYEEAKRRIREWLKKEIR